MILKGVQVCEIVRFKNLALNDGRVYLDLVEPTGVNGSKNLNGVWIPLLKPLNGIGHSVRRAISDPEDAVGRTVRFLGHYRDTTQSCV